MAYPFNNNFGMFPNQNYGMSQTPNYNMVNNMPAPQPSTNKIYVVSADDALSRFASPNSVMIYMQQDETTLYEVYTDSQGKKEIRARALTDCEKAPTVEYVTKEDFDNLKKIVDEMKRGKTNV